MYSQNVRDEHGDSIIPASQRPDGTWRKARRVKEGYVPQEEVPLYESKGKQFQNRLTNPEPITLPSGQKAHQVIPGLFIVEEKDKKHKKKSKNVNEITKVMNQVKISDTPKTQSKPKPAKTETKHKSESKLTKKADSNATTEASDPVKRLRNLKKRLREAEALEEKLKKGEITKPEPDQLAKVERKKDLLLQIRELEKSV